MARNKGVMAATMDDEMLHRQPVKGGWSYEYHSKNDIVTITNDRIVIDAKHLIEFQQKKKLLNDEMEPPPNESLMMTEAEIDEIL